MLIIDILAYSAIGHSEIICNLKISFDISDYTCVKEYPYSYLIAGNLSQLNL